MIIAIDVDSTALDLMTPWLGGYNRDWNDALTPDQITSWDIHKYVKPECGEKIYDYIKDPTIYDRIEPIFGAKTAIGRLRHLGHRVIFVTTSPIETVGRKYHALVEHGLLPKGRKGLADYYEALDKSMIRADVLVDDGGHNIESFPGMGIVFDQPWNRHLKGYPRVLDWVDFLNKLSEGQLFGVHPTELRRPKQVKEFRALLEKMYQTHLDKNADYSPANILGTGEVGLATRTWDKVARMMNLTGFDVEIEEANFTPNVSMMGVIWNKFVPVMQSIGFNVKFASITYREPKKAKNESLEDSLMDFAVYALIWLLQRKGVWGK